MCLNIRKIDKEISIRLKLISIQKEKLFLLEKELAEEYFHKKENFKGKNQRIKMMQYSICKVRELLERLSPENEERKLTLEKLISKRSNSLIELESESQEISKEKHEIIQKIVKIRKQMEQLRIYEEKLIEYSRSIDIINLN